MKNLILITLLFKVLNMYSQTEDIHQWLEEVDAPKAKQWVAEQNKITIDALSQRKEYKNIYDNSLAIYNSSERIAAPSIYGDYIYNFWQDKTNERGIWRRTKRSLYESGSPVWEILLDIDALAKKDNIKWVFKGVDGLYPKYNRFLVNLSKGGGDAIIVREFNVDAKSFIEDGFQIEESKSNASFLDENTVIVGSDFGPGTMTNSGYPNQVKLWKRGTLLKDAKMLFEGNVTDVSSSGYIMRDGTKSYLMVGQGITFYTNNSFVMIDDKLIKLDLPIDAGISGILKDKLIVRLKSDWNVNGNLFNQGSLVSLDFTALIKGQKNVQLILKPSEFSSISEVTSTKNALLINVLTNVVGELFSYKFNNNKWESSKIETPQLGTISIGSTDENSDQFYFYFENFLTPSSLFNGDAVILKTKIVKSLPSFFDATPYKVEQFKAKSKDGTLVPYFMVSSKSIKYDGKNPTLLYAYGGFEVSSQPTYVSAMGKSWLELGGVYVLANIRGGGEYGPKWHQAGLKSKRQNVYDDFYAIAEDLISKKVTSPKNLGIKGGSNGGLLMGVAYTQRPDLFNAVVCAVPLLDMKRFNKLLAGASWMGEYGNPDVPEEWEYIKKFSPYHNLKKEAKYPEVFFTTSTRDDRVHPGHARKMVAKMLEFGHKIYYYENTEGGHAGSSTNDQKAKASALQYSYLLMKLKE